MTQLVLSLFPGIGMLDMAFEEEGFCIVRGPDLLWGGDIRRFHPPAAKFDGVIGGPPCQAFSRLRHLVQYNGFKMAENLIPEFSRCVGEAEPGWWVMENVPSAPAPDIGGSIQSQLVRDVWVGGDTNRYRRFWWSGLDELKIDWLALHRPDPELTVCASGGPRPVPVAVGGSGKVKRSAAKNMGFKTRSYLATALKHSGLPDDFLADAPFTAAGKIKCIGNGVPLAMGRAVARAVKKALGHA